MCCLLFAVVDSMGDSVSFPFILLTFCDEETFDPRLALFASITVRKRTVIFSFGLIFYKEVFYSRKMSKINV